MMFKFLPLAIAISIAAPVSALTVVKVDDRPATAAHAASAAPAQSLAAAIPDSGADRANWAMLFGGVALIAALRLARRTPQVSN
jgi:hypothetical protein